MSEFITLFDTSICSENLGDKLIMEACQDHLFELFPHSQFFYLPTHDVIRKPSYRLVRKSAHTFVGGTNLLSSKMNKYRQWEIGFYDSFKLCDVILMGVGWWQYQTRPNLYTRLLLKRVLSDSHIHAVRDGYTEQQLRSAGFSNVLNTSCPTMWGLSPELCEAIPRDKAEAVICTLTDYYRDPDRDAQILRILIAEYRQVYLWPQGSLDRAYLASLGSLAGAVSVLPPRIADYDHLLRSHQSLDYVGTRLHAGVRSLQHKRRTLIIGVDNRAAELASDTGLPVLGRTRVGQLSAILNSRLRTRIVMPTDAIQAWKGQFKE